MELKNNCEIMNFIKVPMSATMALDKVSKTPCVEDTCVKDTRQQLFLEKAGKPRPADNKQSDNVASQQPAVNKQSDKFASQQPAVNKQSDKVASQQTAVNKQSDKVVSLQPTAYSLQPTAYSLQPTAYSLQPIQHIYIYINSDFKNI